MKTTETHVRSIGKDSIYAKYSNRRGGKGSGDGDELVHSSLLYFLLPAISSSLRLESEMWEELSPGYGL